MSGQGWPEGWKENAVPGTRSQQDQAFWEVVRDLHWRLDDGSRGGAPPSEDEFSHGGGRGAWPTWATHVVAFLLGGLAWGALLFAPPLMPVAAIVAIVTFVTFAVRRRWS